MKQSTAVESFISNSLQTTDDDAVENKYKDSKPTEEQALILQNLSRLLKQWQRLSPLVDASALEGSITEALEQAGSAKIPEAAQHLIQSHGYQTRADLKQAIEPAMRSLEAMFQQDETEQQEAQERHQQLLNQQKELRLQLDEVEDELRSWQRPASVISSSDSDDYRELKQKQLLMEISDDVAELPSDTGKLEDQLQFIAYYKQLKDLWKANGMNTPAAVVEWCKQNQKAVERLTPTVEDHLYLQHEAGEMELPPELVEKIEHRHKRENRPKLTEAESKKQWEAHINSLNNESRRKAEVIALQFQTDPESGRSYHGRDGETHISEQSAISHFDSEARR